MSWAVSKNGVVDTIGDSPLKDVGVITVVAIIAVRHRGVAAPTWTGSQDVMAGGILVRNHRSNSRESNK
ncbi:MAG: hypothetical protein P4M00_20450 [Azospirillaceae bacterium]|nr:hypothetical protein [Azospirillaceae bacterium]